MLIIRYVNQATKLLMVYGMTSRVSVLCFQYDQPILNVTVVSKGIPPPNMYKHHCTIYISEATQVLYMHVHVHLTDHPWFSRLVILVALPFAL